MTRTVTDEERRARLLRRHRLVPQERTNDIPRLVDDLVALHSTDPVTVYLSALARMATPDLAAVEDACYGSRSLVRHHAMRRTLWLSTRLVVRVLHAAATTTLLGPERRRTEGYLAANGIPEPGRWLDGAMAEVSELLAVSGPLPAREVGRRLPHLNHPLDLAPGKRWAATQGAHTRVLLLMGFAGRAVRTRPTGSWVSGEYAWAEPLAWLGMPIAGLEPRPAAAELATRYLGRFGPATTEDLRWWTGWTMRTTRQALQDSGAVAVGTATGPAWLAPGDEAEQGPAGPSVALLPSLDPTVMGWKGRGFYLPPGTEDAFDANGNAGATIWVDGQVVGAWAQRRDGEILVHYFLPVAARRRREVEQLAAHLRETVGATRFSVRFPGAVQGRLLPRPGGALEVSGR